MHEVMSDKLH